MSSFNFCCWLSVCVLATLLASRSCAAETSLRRGYQRSDFQRAQAAQRFAQRGRGGDDEPLQPNAPESEQGQRFPPARVALYGPPSVPGLGAPHNKYGAPVESVDQQQQQQQQQEDRFTLSSFEQEHARDDDDEQLDRNVQLEQLKLEQFDIPFALLQVPAEFLPLPAAYQRNRN